MFKQKDHFIPWGNDCQAYTYVILLIITLQQPISLSLTVSVRCIHYANTSVLVIAKWDALKSLTPLVRNATKISRWKHRLTNETLGRSGAAYEYLHKHNLIVRRYVVLVYFTSQRVDKLRCLGIGHDNNSPRKYTRGGGQMTVSWLFDVSVRGGRFCRNTITIVTVCLSNRSLQLETGGDIEKPCG